MTAQRRRRQLRQEFARLQTDERRQKLNLLTAFYLWITKTRDQRPHIRPGR